MRRWLRLCVIALVVFVLSLAAPVPLQKAAVPQGLKSWDGRGQPISEDLPLSHDPPAAWKTLGGARMVLKVDTDRLRGGLATTLQDDLRRVLRDSRIGYTSLRIVDHSVEVRIRNSDELPLALAALTATLAQPDMGLEMHDAGDSLIRLTPMGEELNMRVRTSLQRSIEILTRRVKELGLERPSVKHLSFDQIEVLFPGLTDPAAALMMRLGLSMSNLSFRMIDSGDITQPIGQRSPDAEVLFARNTNTPYLVQKRLMLGGYDIVASNAILNPFTRAPEVGFSLSAQGSRRLAEATKDNIGSPFVIALDGEVLALLVIREPVLQRHGKIDGVFTEQEASQMATMLRFGIPEAQLIVVEREVIAPTQP